MSPNEWFFIVSGTQYVEYQLSGIVLLVQHGKANQFCKDGLEHKPITSRKVFHCMLKWVEK